jgi:ribosomal protein L16/L10AE
VDAELKIRQVNPQALPVFGEIEGLIGRDLSEVMHILWPAAYADEVVERFRQALQTGAPYFEPEHTEERLDRQVLEHYEWHLHRLPLPDGSHGVVCYFSDISHHVRARGARAGRSAQGRVFGDAGPRAAQPARPLRTGLQIMKLARTDAQKVEQARRMMERQLVQLVRLVDDLLDISRISRAVIDLKKERVELSKIVRVAVETSRPAIEEAGHALTLVLPNEPLFLEADVTRLAQVLSNLPHNAAK